MDHLLTPAAGFDSTEEGALPRPRLSLHSYQAAKHTERTTVSYYFVLVDVVWFFHTMFDFVVESPPDNPPTLGSLRFPNSLSGIPHQRDSPLERERWSLSYSLAPIATTRSAKLARMNNKPVWAKDNVSTSSGQTAGSQSLCWAYRASPASTSFSGSSLCYLPVLLDRLAII